MNTGVIIAVITLAGGGYAGLFAWLRAKDKALGA